MKNKYQEALDYVNKSVCTAMACLGIDDKKTREYLHTLQKLVDKETPKKLTTKKSEFLSSRTGKKLVEYILPFRYCPKCDECVNPNYCEIPNYCSNCGRRLDWGE